MRTPFKTDQELLKSYLQGNEKDLEKLIQRYKNKVYTSIDRKSVV